MIDLTYVSSDHPRVCGEHHEVSEELRPCPGSSPRMRGAPMLATPLGYRVRIIPAYAGSTTA